MNDKKKLWLLLGAVVVAVLALFIVLQPSVLSSGDDPLDALRDPAPVRPAPGQEMGSTPTPSPDDPSAPADGE